MTQSRAFVDQSRFFLTGSDFSELAILDGSVTHELNSSGALEKIAPEILKLAKFKKIDWNAMESNLIR